MTEPEQQAYTDVILHARNFLGNSDADSASPPRLGLLLLLILWQQSGEGSSEVCRTKQ